MTARKRASRNAPIVDLTAVKYLRVIIASYIMAIALGFISGFDANAYFSGIMAHPTTLYVSKVVVIFSALMLFFGYFLRLVSLCLAIVILASSVQTNLIAPMQGSVEAFWGDLLLVCGLLACYCPLSARQLRRQAFIRSVPTSDTAPIDATQKVVPRRVTVSRTPGASVKKPSKLGRGFALIASPLEQEDVLMDRISRLLPPQKEPQDEMTNIFA